MSAINVEDLNKTRLDCLNKVKNENPVLHGLDFDITFAPSDVAITEQQVYDVVQKIVEGLTGGSTITKEAVLSFVEGGVLLENYMSVRLYIFYTKPIEPSELHDEVENVYNEIYKILGKDSVYVHSHFDPLSTHFLDFLNIPYNTDLHSEEGFECFESSVKVNPKLKHLKHSIVKHLRLAA